MYVLKETQRLQRGVKSPITAIGWFSLRISELWNAAVERTAEHRLPSLHLDFDVTAHALLESEIRKMREQEGFVVDVNDCNG